MFLQACFFFFLPLFVKVMMLFLHNNIDCNNVLLSFRYLELMRRLQTTYRMEPAGSQGVWGLDDFQFLPFIWGSSQLIGQAKLEPEHFTCKKNVEEHYLDYMFLDCIRFINQVIIQFLCHFLGVLG